MPDLNDASIPHLMREIEDLKTKTQQLEQYRWILESSADFILVIDPKYKIEFLNRTTDGLSPEQYIGVDALALVSPETIEETKSAIDSVFQGADAATYRTRSVDPNGETQIFDAKVFPLHQESDNKRAVLIVMDVTTRVKAVEELERIYELNPDFIGFTTPDGYFKRLNPSWTKLGYTLEELYAKPFIDFVHPDDVAATLVAIDISDFTKTHYFENRYRTKNGDYLWLSWAYKKDIESQSIHFTARDVTEQRQSKEALDQSEQMYRLLAENASDVITVTTVTGIYTYVSNASESVYGYKPEEMIGKHFADFLHPDDVAKTSIRAKQVLEAVDILPQETGAGFRLRRPDNTYIWVESTIRYVFDPKAAEVIEVIASSRDISARKKTEEALRQSEQMYRLLAENASDVITVTTVTGIYTYVSNASHKVYGYSPQEMIGKHFTDFLHPDDAAMTVSRAEEVRKTANSLPEETVSEFRFRRSDNIYIWVESAVRYVIDLKTDVLVEVTASSRDITARKQSEEAIRQSEKMYRLLAENSTDVINVTAFDGRLKYLSNSCEAVYGYKPETLADMPYSDFVHPDDLPFVDEKLRALGHPGSKGSEIRLEYRVLHANNSYIWVEDVIKAVLNEDLDEVEFISASRDVTERKLVQQESERLASIIETTSDFVGSASMDGYVVYLNPAGRSMVGVSVDADLTRVQISDLSPEWANNVIGNIGMPIALHQGVWTGETAMMDQDHNETPVSQTIILHKNADGSPAFLSTIARDISQQKHAANERERLIKDLQAARRIADENSRLKSEFLATMSHELRTPLNAIEGFTSIMMSKMGGTEYNDKTERYISRVNTNSKRLLGLINDFLDLSRVEAGRLELAYMPFSPSTLVKRWQEEIGVLADRKSITLAISVDPELPEIVYGDEESISKIVLNLLSNAIKFTEEGGVALVLRRDESEWQVIVIDTGIGIPPHAREYIFDEFRQVDQTSKRKYGGTGLGLAIVQKYARAMGGSVTLQSELGEGSTFTVSLPLNTSKLKGKSHE